MTTQVRRWGNSQGVRLPKELPKSAGIKNDDIHGTSIIDGNIVLSRQFKHRTLEERAAAYGGRLGLCEEFEWDSPKGRELW